MRYSYTTLHRFRYLFAGTMFLLSLVMIFAIASAIDSNMVVVSAEPKDRSSTAYSRQVQYSGNPNVVAGGFANAQSQIGDFTSSASFRTRTMIKSSASSTAKAGNMLGRQAKNVSLSALSAVGSGLRVAGSALRSVGSFTVSAPGKVFGAAKNTLEVTKFIRPSERIEDVPIIDPNSVEIARALKALPAKPSTSKNNKVPHSNDTPRWPINGAVTTLFGVPHWPYQPTHSGMDISDGKAPGITPVKAFRSGRVIKTVSSYSGLGNHVVVDHGSGVTSVYGHLASIAVSEGQRVNTQTTLGLEGTTGASTGTHLHFEIRINGQATDPSRFIDGQP